MGDSSLEPRSTWVDVGETSTQVLIRRTAWLRGPPRIDLGGRLRSMGDFSNREMDVGEGSLNVHNQRPLGTNDHFARAQSFQKDMVDLMEVYPSRRKNETPNSATH